MAFRYGLQESGLGNLVARCWYGMSDVGIAWFDALAVIE
jgi:hypothetical protein